MPVRMEIEFILRPIGSCILRLSCCVDVNVNYHVRLTIIIRVGRYSQFWHMRSKRYQFLFDLFLRKKQSRA